MRRASAAWLLCLIALSVTTPACADVGQTIETFTLDNGMKVIVLPNHRVPAVNHMLWFYVGAADDPVGKSGLAHYHEHLMFKGSPAFASGEYVRQLQKHGGEHNAFTGYDTTSYYVTIAKEHLPLVMQLEADRLRGLTVSEAEAEKEKDVVVEERRQRIDNSPAAQLAEQMNAAMFLNHPYQRPMIGWQHEMQGLTLSDARDFHAKYYHPGNAVLIVSGDITADELRPLAKKYYGALPAHTTPERHWLQEPPHLAERHVTLRHQYVNQPAFTRSYKAPSVHMSDKPTAISLVVLSHLLGGGKNSVLYQSLVVEQKLAAAVDVSYNFYAYGFSEFTISIVPEKGISLEKIEQALDKQLANFIKQGVDEAALARTKRMMQAEAMYAREGLTSTSNIMGWIIMAGMEPQDFNRWPEMIEAATASHIMQAAHNLLQPTASVTGYLLPEETP